MFLLKKLYHFQAEYKEYYKQKGKKIDDALIDSEVTADFFAEFMLERDFITKQANIADNRSFLQKAKDKLKAFAAMFRETEAGEAAKKLELMYMAVLNEKGINISTTKYSIGISRQEYAILRKEVVRENAFNKGEIRPVDYAFTANNFYVYENYGDDSYKAIEKLKIVGNEDLIHIIQGEFENGTFNDGKSINTFIKDLKNRQGRNNRNNLNVTGTGDNDGRYDNLSVRQSKGDTSGHFDESSRADGGTEGVHDRGLTKEKYSLPSTKDKVLTKMPEAAAFTSKEKMQDRWTSLLKVVNSLSF